MKNLSVFCLAMFSAVSVFAADANKLGVPSATEIERSVLNEGNCARLEALFAKAGRARVTVDGKEATVLEGWFSATWGGKAMPIEIYRDRPGHHTVSIEIVPERAKESNGHRFELLAVLEQ